MKIKMNEERRVAQMEMELKLTTARMAVKQLEADKLAMKASWIAEDLEALKAQSDAVEVLPIKEDEVQEAKEDIQEAKEDIQEDIKEEAKEHIEYRSSDRVHPAVPSIQVKAAVKSPIQTKVETPAETRARAEAAMLAMLQHNVPATSIESKEEAVKEEVREVKHCESHDYIAAALERTPSPKDDGKHVYDTCAYDITLTPEELKYNREHKAEAQAAKASLERKPARNTVEQVIAEPVVKEDKNPFRKPVESAESKNPFKNFRFCTAC